jgi:hypothetical protein
MVVACLSLFVALGGTGYAASQLANRPGHPAASKKHKVKRGPRGRRGKEGPRGPAGLVGAAGATGTPGATGPAGPSAVRLDYDEPKTDNQLRVVGTIGELSIEAECIPTVKTTLWVYVKSTVAARINYFTSKAGHAEQALTANSKTFLFVFEPTTIGTTDGDAGQFTYRNENRVISVQMAMVANGPTQRCQVFGTAVPAT